MSSKREYKSALKEQLETIKEDITRSEFPTEGLITFTFDIATGETSSILPGWNSTRNPGGDGGTGGQFP